MKRLLTFLPIVLLIPLQVNGQNKCSGKPSTSPLPAVKTKLVAVDEKVAEKEVQETEEAIDESVTTSPLAGLAWMVGTWIDEGQESRVVTECSWAQNGKFLKRSFSVLIDNEVTLHGDQFIGWDPIEGRIRSWTFDSEGGVGQGRWYRDGDRWLVKTTFTLATGEKASATNVITYIDENTVTWQSIGREIAGELQPSIPEVTVVRQSAEPANEESDEEKS